MNTLKLTNILMLLTKLKLDLFIVYLYFNKKKSIKKNLKEKILKNKKIIKGVILLFPINLKEMLCE